MHTGESRPVRGQCELCTRRIQGRVGALSLCSIKIQQADRGVRFAKPDSSILPEADLQGFGRLAEKVTHEGGELATNIRYYQVKVITHKAEPVNTDSIAKCFESESVEQDSYDAGFWQDQKEIVTALLRNQVGPTGEDSTVAKPRRATAFGSLLLWTRQQILQSGGCGCQTHGVCITVAIRQGHV